MESRESSSPIVTRAVAAGLAGNFSDAYSFSVAQKAGLYIVGLLPQRLARWLIPRVQNTIALDGRILESISVNELLQERLKDYRQLNGQFPAITMGSALGGAAAQIALSLGGPFLPQAFVMTLRGGSKKADVSEYLEHSRKYALGFAERNKEVLTIQHFDPIHDGWLTKTTNHVRIKLLQLPKIYQEYICEHLQPGGSIVYLDCGAKWLRYRIGERSVFQVGGWGGILSLEYLQGSERISEYCRREGFGSLPWALTGFPSEEGAESEWGCEPELFDSIAEFCKRSGYRFVPISLSQPHDFSNLAFRIMQARLSLAGLLPEGIVVEMFSQYDATAIMRGGWLPIWLVFNTRDSAEFLKNMLKIAPPHLPVYFSGLATFSITPDMVPMEDWQEILSSRIWTNIGARSSHFPADTHALIGWNRGLRKISQRRGIRFLPILDPDEILRILEER